MGAGAHGIHRGGGTSTQRQAPDQGVEPQGTLAQGQVVQALVQVLRDPVVRVRGSRCRLKWNRNCHWVSVRCFVENEVRVERVVVSGALEVVLVVVKHDDFRQADLAIHSLAVLLHREVPELLWCSWYRCGQSDVCLGCHESDSAFRDSTSVLVAW